MSLETAQLLSPMLPCKPSPTARRTLSGNVVAGQLVMITTGRPLPDVDGVAQALTALLALA